MAKGNLCLMTDQTREDGDVGRTVIDWLTDEIGKGHMPQVAQGFGFQTPSRLGYQ